jgi:predicted nucleotidyltransferase
MESLIEAKHPAIVDLCRRFRVRKLEIFGSAANGRFVPATSDLDFLVEYEVIPHKEHADCYFGLLFALEDLFAREVDLVEAAAIRNPYFLRSIANDRILLYAA